MFKKIIAYVGICLCVVLCFGMFFIKPVKAQMLSQGGEVNTQWFPTYINSPIVGLAEQDVFISYPIELVKDDLRFVNQANISNSAVFYLEAMPDFGGTIEYRNEAFVNSVGGYTFNSLVMNFYTPLAVGYDSNNVNEINIHFDRLILPTNDNYAELDYPFYGEAKNSFCLALPLYFRNGMTGENIVIPKEDFVLDSCTFYRIGRDTNGNLVRKFHSVDLTRVPFDNNDYAYYKEPVSDPLDPQYNSYFLGNILKFDYYANDYPGDLLGLSFGDNFVMVEDFDLSIHLYANTYDIIYTNAEIGTFPTFSLSIPFISTEYEDLTYTMEEYLDISNGFTFEMDIPEPVDMSHWLITSVGAFMNAELFPGFALGGLLAVIIAFPIVVWFLKILAGG